MFHLFSFLSYRAVQRTRSGRQAYSFTCPESQAAPTPSPGQSPAHQGWPQGNATGRPEPGSGLQPCLSVRPAAPAPASVEGPARPPLEDTWLVSSLGQLWLRLL